MKTTTKAMKRSLTKMMEGYELVRIEELTKAPSGTGFYYDNRYMLRNGNDEVDVSKATYWKLLTRNLIKVFAGLPLETTEVVPGKRRVVYGGCSITSKGKALVS